MPQSKSTTSKSKSTVTKKNRVSDKPKTEPKEVEEQITMDKKDFYNAIQQAISEGIKGGQNNAQAATPVVKNEVNTTLTKKFNKRMNEGHRFFNVLANDKDMEIIEIPKMYKEYLGSAVTSTINGSSVKVPVDGKRYWVSKPHYAAIRGKLKYLDDMADKSSRSTELFGNAEGDYQRVRK